MATDTDKFDSGSRDRATVALVYRAVDDLAKLTEAHFETLHTRLDALSGLPVRIDAMEHEITRVKVRLELIEKSDAMQESARERQRSYRRGTLPSILIGLGGLLLTIINLYLIANGRI